MIKKKLRKLNMLATLTNIPIVCVLQVIYDIFPILQTYSFRWFAEYTNYSIPTYYTNSKKICFSRL